MDFRLDQIEERKLYSAGNCPICADSGALLCLKEIESGRLLFFCPTCGVAWRGPDYWPIGEILRVEDLAPKGVTLPTSSEALNSRFAVVEVPFDEWFRSLRLTLAGE